MQFSSLLGWSRNSGLQPPILEFKDLKSFKWECEAFYFAPELRRKGLERARHTQHLRIWQDVGSRRQGLRGARLLIPPPSSYLEKSLSLMSRWLEGIRITER